MKWTKREIFARSIALPLCAVVVLLIGVDAHLSRMEHTGWDTRPCAQFMMRSVLFFQSLGRDIDYDCADSRPMSPVIVTRFLGLGFRPTLYACRSARSARVVDSVHAPWERT